MNTTLAEKMRKAAICDIVRLSALIFININELPQIKQSKINMAQLRNFVFIKRRAKVIKRDDTASIFYIACHNL